MRPITKIGKMRNITDVDPNDPDHIRGVDWYLNMDISDSFIFNESFIEQDLILEAIENVTKN